MLLVVIFESICQILVCHPMTSEPHQTLHKWSIHVICNPILSKISPDPKVPLSNLNIMFLSLPKSKPSPAAKKSHSHANTFHSIYLMCSQAPLSSKLFQIQCHLSIKPKNPFHEPQNIKSQPVIETDERPSLACPKCHTCHVPIATYPQKTLKHKVAFQS